MKITLKQWGNSLAIRIPKVFAVQMGIENGREVDIELKDNQIIISPEEPSLNEMLKNITPEVLHGEMETGPVTGKEVW